MKKIFKYGVLETIKNFLNVKKAFRNYKNYKGEIRKVLPPNNYQKVFHDDFKSPLDTNKWLYGQPWGDFHPENLYWYYDTSGEMAYTNEKGLILKLKNKPKNYIKSELPEWRQLPNLPDKFTIPTGVGLLSTKLSWQYGWFESWIQLPLGQKYWPAFWLSGKETWPPEIDILEAYSHIGPKYEGYRLFNKFWKKSNVKIQPNLHYGSIELDNKDSYGSYDVPVAEVTNRLVQYVCHWEKDFIKIYYDGLLVFETKNKEVLKWFNRETDQMILILNHGRQDTDPNYTPTESEMLISEVSVYQMKK